MKIPSTQGPVCTWVVADQFNTFKKFTADNEEMESFRKLGYKIFEMNVLDSSTRELSRVANSVTKVATWAKAHIDSRLVSDLELAAKLLRKSSHEQIN